MTPNQQSAAEGIAEAKQIAQEVGIAVTELTDNSRVAIYATAISYASFCAIHDVSEDLAIELLVSVYRQISKSQTDETH